MVGCMVDIVSVLRLAMIEKFGLSDAKDAVVCLLIDELLKVPPHRLKSLLDELASLQQGQLRLGFSTFVLVTSGLAGPILATGVAGSQRRLTPIMLPVLAYEDFSGVAIAFRDFFIAHGVDERKEICDGDELLTSLLMRVELAGGHFRSQERIFVRLRDSLDSGMATGPVVC